MLHSTLILFSNKEKVTAKLYLVKQTNVISYCSFIFLSFLLAESDMDPAEWAAKLEDRFYNNHAFKTTQVYNPNYISHFGIVHVSFNVYQYVSVIFMDSLFFSNSLVLKKIPQQMLPVPSESHLMCYQQPGGSTREGEDEHEAEDRKKRWK